MIRASQFSFPLNGLTETHVDERYRASTQREPVSERRFTRCEKRICADTIAELSIQIKSSREEKILPERTGYCCLSDRAMSAGLFRTQNDIFSISPKTTGIILNHEKLT